MSKTLTFAILHFTVAFSVGWLLTGSWLVGSAIALVEPACNTVVFHFHEKVWKRIEARRIAAAPPHSPPDEPYFFSGTGRPICAWANRDR